MKAMILVIGDHQVVRKALRERLELAFPAWSIIEAADEKTALALARDQRLRASVIDLGWPARGWLELARHLKAARPEAQLVVWTMHDGEHYRLDALAAGATAYVLKQETEDKLLAELRTILLAQNGDGSTG